MESENLRLLLEAGESITLQILFVYLLDILADVLESMVWYAIVMLVALKAFQLASAHLLAKRMGDQLGYIWPYTKDEKQRIYGVFARGLELERLEGRVPDDAEMRVGWQGGFAG